MCRVSKASPNLHGDVCGRRFLFADIGLPQALPSIDKPVRNLCSVSHSIHEGLCSGNRVQYRHKRMMRAANLAVRNAQRLCQRLLLLLVGVPWQPQVRKHKRWVSSNSDGGAWLRDASAREGAITGGKCCCRTKTAAHRQLAWENSFVRAL